MQNSKLPYYEVINQEEEIYNHARKSNLPLMLKGPTGTGKSRFVEYLAAKHNQKLYTVSCHDETSAIDLLGRYLILGTETKWVDGPLTRAVREGAFIYLDELAEARPDTIVILHSLTDFRRSLYLDRTNEEIKAADEFMLFASYNPGYQGSFKEIKPSTKQRFVSINFDYPAPKIEIKIIIQETDVEQKIAEKLVQLAKKIRNLVELGLTESVSTRLLVDAAFLIHSGLAIRTACKAAIAESLSDDRETVTAIADLINLYF